MDYWKSKVLPKMKLIFVKTGSQKAAAAAAEVVKAFDESKVHSTARLPLISREHTLLYMDVLWLKRECIIICCA
jgi:hypothetical protein